jgi:hypothetical protein
LTGVLFVVLALVAIAVIPSLLNISGPTATPDSMVATGIVGVLFGLIGLGLTPRRVSTVALSRAGRYKAPSIMGGTIALSLLFAGIGVIALGAVLSAA